jgi:hypothetical protein
MQNDYKWNVLSRIWDSHSGSYKELYLLVRWKSTEVSEEHAGSIFIVEVKAKQETSMKQVASSVFLRRLRIVFTRIHGYA